MWRAWQSLSTSRPYGWAEGPIPWTAIDRYAERHGITGERFEELERLIQAIDGAYLEWRAERSKQKK